MFKHPWKNIFKKEKNEILVISNKEQAIDISQAKGKTCIPILNKNIINNEISRIENNNITYRYCEFTTRDYMDYLYTKHKGRKVKLQTYNNILHKDRWMVVDTHPEPSK